MARLVEDSREGIDRRLREAQAAAEAGYAFDGNGNDEEAAEAKLKKKRREQLAAAAVRALSADYNKLKANHHIEFMTQELEWRTRRQAMGVVQRQSETRQNDALAQAARVSQRVEDHIAATRAAIEGRGDIRKRIATEQAAGIARDVLHAAPDGENDGISGSGGSSKVYTAREDVRMRLLFADYEHGCKTRHKIDEIRAVHPHVSEPEAFLALAEAVGSVDGAIGRLTDVGFYRDVSGFCSLTRRVEHDVAGKNKPLGVRPAERDMSQFPPVQSIVGAASHETGTEKQPQDRKDNKAAVVDAGGGSNDQEGGGNGGGGNSQGSGGAAFTGKTEHGAVARKTFQEFQRWRKQGDRLHAAAKAAKEGTGEECGNTTSTIQWRGPLDGPDRSSKGAKTQARASLDPFLSPAVIKLSKLVAGTPYMVRPALKLHKRQGPASNGPASVLAKRHQQYRTPLADQFPAFARGALSADNSWRGTNGDRQPLRQTGRANATSADVTPKPRGAWIDGDDEATAAKVHGSGKGGRRASSRTFLPRRKAVLSSPDRPQTKTTNKRAVRGPGSAAARGLSSAGGGGTGRGGRKRSSPVGAFGGINRSVDRPTQEFKNVQFAVAQLRPMPTEIYQYKSPYHQYTSVEK